jgi:hypothetical protein
MWNFFFPARINEAAFNLFLTGTNSSAKLSIHTFLPPLKSGSGGRPLYSPKKKLAITASAGRCIQAPGLTAEERFSRFIAQYLLCMNRVPHCLIASCPGITRKHSAVFADRWPVELLDIYQEKLLSDINEAAVKRP